LLLKGKLLNWIFEFLTNELVNGTPKITRVEFHRNSAKLTTTFDVQNHSWTNTKFNNSLFLIKKKLNNFKRKSSKDLDGVTNFSKQWLLNLNADESVVLRIVDDNPQKQYYIGDTQLKSVTSRNDLEKQFQIIYRPCQTQITATCWIRLVKTKLH
jgi:hypothetical protein